MSSYTKSKKKPGRPALSKEPTVQLAFKAPESFKTKVDRAVSKLGKLGHETNESEVLRIALADTDLVEVYLRANGG